MSGFATGAALLSLLSAVCFVLGLQLMGSPATARRGNQLSGAGMTVAVATSIGVQVHGGRMSTTSALVLTVGLVLGGAAGLVAARRVRMTDMPQLVSLFNAVGGGAAALVAVGAVVAERRTTGSLATVLDVVLGALTFTGSLVAAGKLAGRLPGRPLLLPGGRLLSAALGAVVPLLGVLVLVDWHAGGMLAAAGLCALVLGVTLSLPIGGADMPVVISLLNACTGTAVAMAGFVLENTLLVIAGALVGAAGTILTLLMAAAMNRSLSSILLGGFGTGDDAVAGASATRAGVRETTADDVALLLAYARKVVIVPGYGLAAAQAQHELVALATSLQDRGVEVSYGIHPVAGRMPGHMNVLLAEADVPYPQLRDLDEVNPEFARTDVVLVVGANDVTNPAARRPGNAVSGMPILDVDHARSVVVVKRSMGTGYAGIDNELYTDPRTSMLFGDAKTVLQSLRQALTAYIA